MKKYIQIVDDWANKAVKTIEVTGKAPEHVYKIIDGIEINLNH